MIDIVFAENLRAAKGTKQALAGALANFRQIKSPEEAKSAARVRNALLYAPGYEFDDGFCKDLKKNGGALVFAFSDVLSERGFRRAIVISKMRLAMAACRKSGCGFVACTLAKGGNETRNARELEAFMSVLGMNQHEKDFCGKTLERLVA